MNIARTVLRRVSLPGPRSLFLLLLVLLLTAILSCVSKQPPLDGCAGFRKVPPRTMTDLARRLDPKTQGLADWNALAPALRRSLDYVRSRPSNLLAVRDGEISLTWSQLETSLTDLIDLLPTLDERPELLTERFTWLALKPRTLMTGYYEPLVRASLTPRPDYPYPIYGVPEDLRTLDLGEFHPRWEGQTLTYRTSLELPPECPEARMQDPTTTTEANRPPDTDRQPMDCDPVVRVEPYFDRYEIETLDALKDRAPVLAWARDEVDVFFLQIQGSGRLLLPDGTFRHVLYAGKNGHPYVSLGRVMINRGYLPAEEMSMQAIRRFLDRNPWTVRELLHENPSFVFFRLDDEGPIGSMNRELTPMVSVAVDRGVVPLGAVIAAETTLPRPDSDDPRPFQALLLAQDTGGAIKCSRADLFCGFGAEPEFLAGHMQQEASLYLLISNSALEAARIPSQ